MKHIQNNQKSIDKSQEKILRTKSLETFAKCLWFPKRKSYPRRVLHLIWEEKSMIVVFQWLRSPEYLWHFSRETYIFSSLRGCIWSLYGKHFLKKKAALKKYVNFVVGVIRMSKIEKEMWDILADFLHDLRVWPLPWSRHSSSRPFLHRYLFAYFTLICMT